METLRAQQEAKRDKEPRTGSEEEHLLGKQNSERSRADAGTTYVDRRFLINSIAVEPTQGPHSFDHLAVLRTALCCASVSRVALYSSLPLAFEAEKSKLGR